MSEDDIFRALAKPDYDTLTERMRAASPLNLETFLKKNHWSYYEYLYVQKERRDRAVTEILERITKSIGNEI